MKRARRTTPVVVPGAIGMDDETFFKHLNARHLADLGFSSPIDLSPLYSNSLISTHRSYHRRLHEIAVPGQHNHEHNQEN
jgi:hypothetical protein